MITKFVERLEFGVRMSPQRTDLDYKCSIAAVHLVGSIVTFCAIKLQA